MDKGHPGGPRGCGDPQWFFYVCCDIQRVPARGYGLSPLLWCLVVDDLINRLSGSGIYIQGYADDKCLLAVGKFASGHMQWAILTVEAWWNDVGLSVNPEKAEPVAFARKLPDFLEPHLLGVTLSLSRPVKYLVVILDSRLTWRDHVDIKMKKAHSLLWACSRACGAR